MTKTILQMSNRFTEIGAMFLALCLCSTVLIAQEKAKTPPPDAQESRIQENLKTKVSVDFVQTPLSEALSFLAEEHHLPIFIDHKALDDLGIGEDTPINDHFKDITLASALRRLLRPLELTTVVRHGVLMVTTYEEAESQLVLKTYDVSDLVSEAVGDDEPAIGANALIDLIAGTISPDTWDEVGGAGAIEYFRGTLTISQVDECHEMVADFLEGFRAARKVAYESGFDAPAVPFARISGVDPSIEGRVYAALEGFVDLEFVETPLSEVVAFLSDLLDVNVMLDALALDDLGLNADAPITFQANQLQLKSALTIMLQELELTFLVRDESLVITTPEESETLLITRCYPVLDLVADVRRSADLHAIASRDYDALIALIVATVEPDAWDEVGGAGALAGLDGVLTLSQTFDVHEEVLNLLSQLRNKLKNRPEGNAMQPFYPRAMKLEAYRVRFPQFQTKLATPAAKKQSQAATHARSPVQAQFGGGTVGQAFGPVSYDPAGLQDVVRQLVAPQSWNEDGVYLRPVSDTLIIRQTPAVHKKIRALFRKLGIQGFAAGGGRCFGGGGGFF